jgi:hypothetical protein
MNPSRATIVAVALQTIVAAIMSWKGSRSVCQMLDGIGQAPDKDEWALWMTRAMSHELFPFTAIVLVVVAVLIAARVRPDRLPWAAFGFVLGGSIFLFGVILLLVRAAAAIGPKML